MAIKIMLLIDYIMLVWTNFGHTPKPEAGYMRVLGVIEAINLKNLGMYGVGNGMFESRYKQQATVTLNSCSGVLQCNFLKVLE